MCKGKALFLLLIGECLDRGHQVKRTRLAGSLFEFVINGYNCFEISENIGLELTPEIIKNLEMTNHKLVDSQRRATINFTISRVNRNSCYSVYFS